MSTPVSTATGEEPLALPASGDAFCFLEGAGPTDKSLPAWAVLQLNCAAKTTRNTQSYPQMGQTGISRACTHLSDP